MDVIGFFKGGGVQAEGVFLGKPEDSGREEWGTLGKIRGITNPLLRTLLECVGSYFDGVWANFIATFPAGWSPQKVL